MSITSSSTKNFQNFPTVGPIQASPSAPSHPSHNPLQLPSKNNAIEASLSILSPIRESSVKKIDLRLPTLKRIDIRTNTTELQKQIFLLRQQKRKLQKEKDEEPTRFLEFQNEYKQQLEEEKHDKIIERKASIEKTKRNVVSLQKKIVEEKLEMARKNRSAFLEELEKVNSEIQMEKEKILELKRLNVSQVHFAVEQVRARKSEVGKANRLETRSLLLQGEKKLAEEREKVMENAKKVREDIAHHSDHHVDAFKSKIEISQTSFLAQISDEETKQLIQETRQKDQDWITNEIERHRQLKKEKQEQMLKILEEIEQEREEREIKHQIERQKKFELKEAEDKVRRDAEDEKVLELEKKLTLKRERKVKEAIEMEETMRMIEANNRYLSLGRGCSTAKLFKSRQDTNLRTAKERQIDNLLNQKIKRTSDSKSVGELQNLDTLLGL